MKKKEKQLMRELDKLFNQMSGSQDGTYCFCDECHKIKAVKDGGHFPEESLCKCEDELRAKCNMIVAMVRESESPGVSRTPHRCPVCNGRRVVRHDFYQDLGSSTVASLSEVACQTCNGTGVLWS